MKDRKHTANMTDEIIKSHIIIEDAVTQIKDIKLRKIEPGAVRARVEQFTKLAKEQHDDYITNRANSTLMEAATMAEALIDDIKNNFDRMHGALTHLTRQKRRKTVILKEILILSTELVTATLSAIMRNSITPLDNLNDDYKAYTLITETPEHLFNEFRSACRNEIGISRLQYTLDIQENNIANWETRIGILNRSRHFSGQIRTLKDKLQEFRIALDYHTDLKSTLDGILDTMVNVSLSLTKQKIIDEDKRTATTRAQQTQKEEKA